VGHPGRSRSVGAHRPDRFDGIGTSQSQQAERRVVCHLDCGRARTADLHSSVQVAAVGYANYPRCWSGGDTSRLGDVAGFDQAL